MLNSFTSYISYFEAGEDMTDEEYGMYMRAIHNFAYKDIEPDYSTLPPLVKASLRTVIASVRKNKEDRLNGGKGGRPRKVSENTKGGLSEKERGGYFLTETNVNVKENEKEYDDMPPSPTISEPQQNYAKLVFEKFCDNNLPCQNGDYFKFLSFDFRLGLEKVHGINSADVLQAIDNYILELKNPESYIEKQFSFNAFVESKTFTNCLPSNYRPENFKKFMTKAEKEKAEKDKVNARETEYKNVINTHPKVCPDCGVTLIDVSGTGIAWMCPECHSEWDLKNKDWVRIVDEVPQEQGYGFFDMVK